MKLCLVMIITLSIFTDLTSASVDVSGLVSGCESITNCMDSDFHQESNKNSSSNDESKHCHCHQGHSHNIVVTSSFVPTSIHNLKFSVDYPETVNSDINNYFFDINRPPIV